ncbi:hypothetical protein ACFX19_024271 [Malus domestica]
MCFLERLRVGFTTLVYLKDGLEYTGGLLDSLFFLSRHLAYLLHWHALSESIH